MLRNLLLWTLAFIITITIAVYQRMTGPTHPVSGSVKIDNEIIEYRFYRSHGGKSDHQVVLVTGKASFNAVLFWKRFKTNDEFTSVRFFTRGDSLVAVLPHQPPAGKLEYFVNVKSQTGVVKLPEKENIVIRFKGDVPTWVLIPHVITMFGAMLLSTRTGLEYFSKKNNFKILTYSTLMFLFIGGLILGPVVQKFAFDAYWTGFPFGHDLTDNKTVIAFLIWLFALFMYSKSQNPRMWALIGSVGLIIVYLIPHSVMGSELDYNKIDKLNNKIDSSAVVNSNK
ncbi:MAG: hypothetical protein PVH88_01675 [Ignavibacteria bacterium]|jgi:hypothetical protein